MFGYNADGIKPSGGIRSPVPDGDYLLRIVDTEEKKSKGGNDQVVVTFQVHKGEYEGRTIPFHYVTFLDPTNEGAGIALHFLKCIGQPFEGDFTVNHLKWRGKILNAQVGSEEYNGYINNRVKNVDAVTAGESRDGEGKIEEAPF